MRFKIHPLFKWHVVFWLSYTLFKVYHEFVWIFLKYEDLSPSVILTTAVLAQITMLPTKIAFTYWVIYKLLPSNYTPVRKWGYFILCLIATVTVYRLIVVYFTLPLVYQELPDSQQIFSLERISSALIDILLVSGIGIALILLHRQQKARQREKELEKEKLAAELQFLKQQTNPHFLFNTLNNLYALARKKSDDTPEAIMQLSHLMRYVLYETSTKKVAISKELEVIKHYIDLEKLRYGDRLSIDLVIDEKLNGQLVAPLLFLPLVENAFKHGVSEIASNSIIEIVLTLDKNSLVFQVKNSIKTRSGNHKEGIGLKNLRRQLELQYPDHTFETEEFEDCFKAYLKINLSGE